MNDFNLENEIVEITDDNSDTKKEEIETLEETKEEEIPKRSIKNRKKTLKEKWDDLDKNKKIVIIVVGVIVLLLIIGLILYFTIFKKETQNPTEPVEKVVLEKDNYRYENGYLVFLDKSDREIGRYECKNKNSDECLVAKSDFSKDEFERVLTVNENGQEIEKNTQIYHDNYVFVKDGKIIFLYDIEKNSSDLELNNVKDYNTEDNLVVIEDSNNKYGLIQINANGFEYLIRPSYDYLGIINPSLAYLVAEDKGDNYIINSSGKKLSDNIKVSIKSANSNYIVGTRNNRYNLYDYEYNELLSDYDYIGLHDEVISLVKSSRVYFMSSKLVDLNDSDGIRLENSDYVKKYVYDKDNHLIDTKVAYEVSVNNDILTVTIGEDIKNINMLEGLVSNNLDYISYFDGKLYFYSDEDKKDVIGTYTCTNKNEIKNINSKLENCYVYSDSDKLSGIYNNQYVFISDNTNNSEKVYYLYDLKSKKVKGTYSSLEFVNKKELSEKISNIYTGSSFVIAKSASGTNKGNFGVLEISNNKVSGKISFGYESILKVNDYYLMITNNDKSYSIYEDSFNQISNEFDYIELFDHYFVGIKNNELNVYSYVSNPLVGILKESIKTNSNSFTIDFSNGFKITVNGNTYEYDKNGSPKEEEKPVTPNDTPTTGTDSSTDNDNRAEGDEIR